MPNTHPELEEIKRAYKEQQERQIRFEVAYVEGRKRLFDDVSNLAQGLLDLTEISRDTSIRVKGLEGGQKEMKGDLLTLKTDTGELKQTAAKVDAGLEALGKQLTERFETEDVERGKLLAELAGLHKADSSLATNDSEMREEITEVREGYKSATTKLEVDRARTTMRQGVATAFGGALVSYLKANPDAFERVWRFVGHLFQP